MSNSMTGRDLIIYIMENNLEDTPIFENGRLLGFLTIEEVAVKANVGQATVRAWIDQGRIDAVHIYDNYYIPYVLNELNAKD